MLPESRANFGGTTLLFIIKVSRWSRGCIVLWSIRWYSIGFPIKRKCFRVALGIFFFSNDILLKAVRGI
jgi:hypothetical protein